MYIKINDEWILTNDNRNFILAHKESNKYDEEYFYTTLEGVLSGIVKHELLKSKAETFQEFKEEINEIIIKLEKIKVNMKNWIFEDINNKNITNNELKLFKIV